MYGTLRCVSTRRGSAGRTRARSVAIVSQFTHPHDHEIRLKRIATTLIDDGHDVHVLAKWSPGHERFEVEADGLRVHRLTVGRWVPGLNRALSVHLSFNPIWLVWVWWTCRRAGIDLIIARNLRLSPPATAAARLLGIPVIADLSENYEALARIEGRSRPHHFITRIPVLERLFERLTVRGADHIFAVTSENEERLVALGPVNGSKVSTLGNLPLAATIASIDRLAGSRTHEPEHLELVFLGIVDGLRGLDVVIEALSKANADLDRGSIGLTVVGDGPARRDLERYADSLGIGERVRFTGWITSDEKYRYLLDADAGLVPHIDCELCQTTVPNKLFDYMAARLPVIATDLGPVRRILEREDCGVVVPWDAGGMAESLVDIQRGDRSALVKLGANGRRAIECTYNWSIEQDKLRATIDRIAS